jgi:hypothetical protein
MTTADWALLISIISALISLAGFVWNVWSTFIYPKAKVRVSFDMVQIVEMGSDWTPSVLRLSATNMGPGEITLSNALITYRGPFNQSNGFGLLSTLADFPRLQDHAKGYLGAGFPAKLAVGEQYSAYLVPAHHALAKGDYQRIGFTDSFGRSHWAPRRDILHALHSIRDACEKAGINWRAPV